MPFGKLNDFPGFEEMLIAAQQRYDALPPDQQRAMRDAQRKSWVIGNFMLDHPTATRDEVEEIYQKVVEGVGL